VFGVDAAVRQARHLWQAWRTGTRSHYQVRMLTISIFSPADPENGDRYFVSPITGELIVIPDTALQRSDAQRTLRRRGIHLADVRTQSLLGMPVSPLNEQRIGQLPKDRSQVWLRSTLPLMAAGARILSLTRLAEWISRIPVRRSPKRWREVVADLRMFAADHPRSCLITSFHQAASVLRQGLSCHLTIGVWIPTTDMHAWTTIVQSDREKEREYLISDDPDKIGHYQPALRFSFRNGDHAHPHGIPT
jgi:hypothetical protein